MANERVTLDEFLTDKKFKQMSLEELTRFIGRMDWHDYNQLDGVFSSDKAKIIYAELHPKETKDTDTPHT